MLSSRCKLQMEKRFIIVGFALSEPGTMGGNSKIALEIARHLKGAGEVHFIVPSTKTRTIAEAIGAPPGLVVHEVPAFEGGDLRRPVASARHYTGILRHLLTELAVGPQDIVYSCSDFHIDTLPCRRLQPVFKFRWIAVQFLFVPFIFENLIRGYKFPAFKYLLVWLYSNVLFRLARQRAAAFVITNDSDRGHFPAAFQKRVFPFYGGVNVDQIPTAEVPQTRDVVFCSRLHPQKGIDGFLDIWAKVKEACPAARLTVIGNGAPAYEQMLKAKAARLGVADSIDWLGYVNHEAKYEIYRSARVMVHPTVFDNNGMVAAEALCSGLPVVMYDLPALREVYTTGCVKVPFGDQAAFAEAVVRLLSDLVSLQEARPNETQLVEMRNHWDWTNRVVQFQNWLSVGGMVKDCIQ